MAEQLLKWVPPKTHEFEKFITPEELDKRLNEVGLHRFSRCGLVYEPWGQRWRLVDESFPGALAMNYIVAARKSNLEDSSKHRINLE
jgi:2-polyprenyl-6-hydroxyphenyl methylase/3-demethylubiquinone-9 3-methyltransferase